METIDSYFQAISTHNSEIYTLVVAKTNSLMYIQLSFSPITQFKEIYSTTSIGGGLGKANMVDPPTFPGYNSLKKG